MAGRVAVNGIVSAKKSVSVIKLFAGEHLEGRLAKKRVYAPAASGKANGHKGISADDTHYCFLTDQRKKRNRENVNCRVRTRCFFVWELRQLYTPAEKANMINTATGSTFVNRKAAWKFQLLPRQLKENMLSRLMFKIVKI